MMGIIFSMMNKPFSKEAFQNFKDALDVTWKGMLVIFVVMLIFYGIIVLLSKIKVTDKK
jgi:hypothetical protein